MLPCGGVGVRENTHTQLYNCLQLSMNPIKANATFDERQSHFKEATGHARENGKKDRILKRKRKFHLCSANACLAVHVGP